MLRVGCIKTFSVELLGERGVPLLHRRNCPCVVTSKDHVVLVIKTFDGGRID